MYSPFIDGILKEEIAKLLAISIPISQNISSRVRIVNSDILGSCALFNGTFIISISSSLDSLEEIRSVIDHELVHTCSSCFNHGTQFSRYKSIIDNVYHLDI